MNEIIERYIRENVSFDFIKEYVSAIQVNLKEGNSTMTILQCFDSVVAYIDNTYLGTFIESRDRQGNKIWRCSSNLNL